MEGELLIINMKKKLLLGAMLLCGTLSFAQTSDPVVMTINGKNIARSEFEYSYNKTMPTV